MREDCSVQRNQEVRAEVTRLRGASDDQLRAYDKERETRRIAWYHQTQNAARPEADPLERAYRVLLQKLGVQEDQAPIVQMDGKAIIFHSKNFCPTLEACKILGLDTRRVCRLYNEKSTDALVRQVDPRLTFSRNHERLRPYSEYCEESISYRDDAGRLPDKSRMTHKNRGF
jgi:tRNA(adenine34) deaminase